MVGEQLAEQEMQILVNYMVEKGVTREAGEDEAKFRERIQLAINRMKTNARKPMETDAEYGKRIAKQLKKNLGAQKRSLKKKEEQKQDTKKSKQQEEEANFDQVQAERNAIMQQRYEIMRQRRTEEARWSMEHAEWKRQADLRKEDLNPLKNITRLEDMAAMYAAGKATIQQVQDRLATLWDNETGIGQTKSEIATVDGTGVYALVMRYIEEYDSEEEVSVDERPQASDFVLAYDLKDNELLGPFDQNSFKQLYGNDPHVAVLYSK